MGLRVEVFPIDVRRWVAVIEGLGGPFSTEAQHPGDVPTAVSESIRKVLGHEPADIDFVDDLGSPWIADGAEEQRRRLGIGAG